ncbi:MAG: hypothetical protein MUE41_08470 [Gemmatimonadaceae bacterium]|nr:hypothetical protein [Gemmatimonadaceae bacterium]
MSSPSFDSLALSAAPVGGTLFGRSHARSRLWLGITGVGLTVCCALWLVLVPTAASTLAIRLSDLLGVAASAQSLRGAVGTAVLVAWLHALVLFPVDVVGGVIVVREPVPILRWLARWARGLAVTSLVIAASAGALYGGYVLLGTVGVVMAGLVLQVAWVMAQGWLALLTGGVRFVPLSDALRTAVARAELPLEQVREVEADDIGFVGGWIGTAPTLWVPAAWTRGMSRDALASQLVRRRLVLASGLRTRGVLGAIAWNAIGVAWFAIGAPVLPSNVILFMCGVTLWSFLGVLLLPTPSRRAIFATDRDTARAIGADGVVEAMHFIDARQDDEPTRTRGIETVFHPVPSRASRDEAIMRPNPPNAPRGAYHLTRLMLGGSSAALGLLGRAVHCNVGRPGLWVVYPGD